MADNISKMAERKAFNFYRSYFDVFIELEKDKDKLAFITALLERQFYGTIPNNLSGMAKFAYMSQRFNIDSQVDGYESKTGLKLSDSQTNSTPCTGGLIGGSEGGSIQEKGKEEGKEKGKEEVEQPTSTKADERVYITSKKKELKGKRLETFETFWTLFNYKRSKSEAAQAWYDIPKLTTELCNIIFEAAKKESSRRIDIEASGRTPKMAQGWITSRRWEDEDVNTESKERYNPFKAQLNKE